MQGFEGFRVVPVLAAFKRRSAGRFFEMIGKKISILVSCNDEAVVEVPIPENIFQLCSYLFILVLPKILAPPERRFPIFRSLRGPRFCSYQSPFSSSTAHVGHFGGGRLV